MPLIWAMQVPMKNNAFLLAFLNENVLEGHFLDEITSEL